MRQDMYSLQCHLWVHCCLYLKLKAKFLIWQSCSPGLNIYLYRHCLNGNIGCPMWLTHQLFNIINQWGWGAGSVLTISYAQEVYKNLRGKRLHDVSSRCTSLFKCTVLLVLTERISVSSSQTLSLNSGLLSLILTIQYNTEPLTS